MAQFLGACSCLGQHLVAEGQQVPSDLRRGVGQKRQQVDFGVPEVMPFIGLSGEALRRYARVFGARRGLQDVKEIETDRLLDLDGLRFVRSSLISLTRTSLRRQKSSMYCSWEASSLLESHESSRDPSSTRHGRRALQRKPSARCDRRCIW